MDVSDFNDTPEVTQRKVQLAIVETISARILHLVKAQINFQQIPLEWTGIELREYMYDLYKGERRSIGPMKQIKYRDDKRKSLL